MKRGQGYNVFIKKNVNFFKVVSVDYMQYNVSDYSTFRNLFTGTCMVFKVSVYLYTLAKEFAEGLSRKGSNMYS